MGKVIDPLYAHIYTLSVWKFQVYSAYQLELAFGIFSLIKLLIVASLWVKVDLI